MRIANKRSAPPGGWRYFSEPHNVLVQAAAFKQLVGLVGDLYLANGDPPPMELADKVEQWICEQNGVACQEKKPSNWREKPKALFSGGELTLSHIYAGTRMLVNWFKAGKPCVEEKEATRRADICLQCPNNKAITCGACAKVYKHLRALEPKKNWALSRNLAACKVCKCSNPVQVWIPLALLDMKPESEPQYPGFCWKLEALREQENVREKVQEKAFVS